MPKFDELGSSGLQEFGGFINEAYHAELKWPSVQPLYSRLRRSDAEIATVRQVFTALVRGCSIDWTLPDEPTDADKEAQEFAQSVTDDIDGGPGAFLETLVSQVPFFGWGWWEVLPGRRQAGWTPPDKSDDWRSGYDDGRIGIRRLAWRDTSSFDRWEFGGTGRLTGMWQNAFPRPAVLLPLDRSVHVVFGDPHNPEGLSPLEAVWRLERIKYGLEVVQGIGFEHSAGYLDVTAEQTLTDQDKIEVQRAARAIMSAKEGNYAAWPKGVTGELKDVSFAAAAAILEAIRYYGILKLMVYNMQWMALSSVSGSGSFAAMSDSSSMFVMTFNAMMEGFGAQLDAQIGRRLFEWNNFPGLTARPRLIITPVEKTIGLGELASLLGPLTNTIPLGDEDYIAIRRRTGFLPETLPEVESEPEPDDAAPEPAEGDEEGDAEPNTPAEPEGEDEADGGEVSEQAMALAQRQAYWQRYLLEHPEAVSK
jgi:hypothetical protein